MVYIMYHSLLWPQCTHLMATSSRTMLYVTNQLKQVSWTWQWIWFLVLQWLPQSPDLSPKRDLCDVLEWAIYISDVQLTNTVHPCCWALSKCVFWFRLRASFKKFLIFLTSFFRTDCFTFTVQSINNNDNRKKTFSVTLELFGSESRVITSKSLRENQTLTLVIFKQNIILLARLDADCGDTPGDLRAFCS